jgi:hypothetical protein
MAFTETNDITKPAGTRARSLGDDDIREFKRLEVERQAVDHDRRDDEGGAEKTVTPTGTIGYHKKATLLVRSSAESEVANAVVLYAKDDASTAELYVTDEAGNIISLTQKGFLRITSGRLNYNYWLNSWNAATNAVVELIRATTGNIPEITKGAILSGSDAPTVDAGIANKKYVDDSIVVNTETEKTVPVAADLVLVEDSAAAYTRKKMQYSNLWGSLRDYASSASASTAKTLKDIKVCWGYITATKSTTTTISNLPFTSATTYTVQLTLNNDSTDDIAFRFKATRDSGAAFHIRCTDDSHDHAVYWLAIGY